MERLTKRIDRSVYYTKGKYEETLPSECEIRDVRNILYRLAAYEDTGLEPKEVEGVRCGAILWCNAFIHEKEKREHDTQVAEEIEALGLSPDRLRELAQADKEGRCFLLPKDGMVYYIEEAGGEKWIGNKPIQQVIVRCGFGMALLEYSLFDKSKYFTREEAEAALRRNDQNG